MSLVENFRSAPPRRQALFVGAAALLLTVIFVVTYLVLFTRPYGVLFSNLRTLDAATITAELDKKKIPYHLADGGQTILVPRDMVDSTRLSIAGEDLPLKGQVGFELFNKSDMGLTEFAQRINYQRALQGELARTIMTMAPIDTARVHLMLAEPTAFRDDRQPSKASVTILVRPGWKLSSDTIVGIERLVAASVPDLSAGDVVVLDGDGKPVGGDEAPAPASPQVVERTAIQQYYVARLEQALGAVFPGHTDVTVEARTAPTTSAIDGAGAALDTWTPKARSFPLTIAISFPTPPSPEVQAQVKALAARVIELDPAKGDSLTIGASFADDTVAPGSVRLATPPTHDMPQASAATQRRPRGLPLWEIILFGVAVLCAGAFTLWASQRTAPRRLSDRDRVAFAKRLGSLINESEEHAASPV